jgi:tol-pal system protein YbgF
MHKAVHPFLPLKAVWPLIGAPIFGLALFGTHALAQDVPLQDAAPSARLDRLQTQMDGLRSKLLVAQGYGYGRPPGTIGDADDGYNAAPRQDAAGLDVRIGHIEEQMRQMNGQIEQIQFAQHKLEDQLKKFQQDVDFRFQDSGHGAASRPQKRTDASESEIGAPTNPSTTTNAANDFSPSNGASASSVPLHGSHRGDAFDPASDPNAPGVPHQLGSIASSATPLPPPPSAPKTVAENRASSTIIDEDADPDAPLDLSTGKRNGVAPPSSTPGFGTAAAPRQIPLTPSPATPSSAVGMTTMAGVPPIASPKEEFDIALGYFKQKEYENAEKGFSSFLQKNPKNRMAADAVYYLGETYFQRGRQREAAEQYLKISTNYSTSAHAPEAMLRLGQSLSALGAKEQACATFDEVPRKYPNASAFVKTNAEKEAQRAKC